MPTDPIRGVNEGYLLELYEQYQRNPQAVDAETRKFFQSWAPETVVPATSVVSGINPEVIVGAVNLAQSIRRYGHLAATIDPLGSRPLGDPALLPEPETNCARKLVSYGRLPLPG